MFSTGTTFVYRTVEDALDPAERIALHLLGKLALNLYLSRGAIDPDQAAGLIATLTEGVREGLNSMTADEREALLSDEDVTTLRAGRMRP